MENFLYVGGNVYSPDQYVDSSIAAIFLGLSKRTVRDLAARRILPVAKFGKANRFRMSDLQDWAQQRHVTVGGGV